MVESGYPAHTETSDAAQAAMPDLGSADAAAADGQADAGSDADASRTLDGSSNSGAAAATGASTETPSGAQATTAEATTVASASAGTGEVPSTASSTAKSGYPQFLEKFRHPSAQPVVNEVRDFVTDFPQVGLTRLQQAGKIHEFLGAATQHLLATDVFADEVGDEGAAAEGLEKFVIIKLFKVLFRPVEDARADELVSRRLQEHKEQASTDSELEKFTPESQEIFDRAVAEVRKVDQYRAPRDKVVCMLNAYHLVESVADELRRTADSSEASAGSDAHLLRGVLKKLVVEASPPNLFSNLEFTAAFRQPKRLTREEKRCLRNLAAALEAKTGVRLEAFGPGGCGGACEDLPLWLTNTGVTFRFETIETGDLLIGEVGELLEECQQMVQALRELAEPPGQVD